MIQLKQSKKVKGARRKARDEVLERLLLRYPTWFEGKTDKEIKYIITAFRLSGNDDDNFPMFCIEYESRIERMNQDVK